MSKRKTAGGARPGAGRPAGSGKYAESTRVLRVPDSAVGSVLSFLEDYRLQRLAAALPVRAVAAEAPRLHLPRILTRIPAGQAMAAADEIRDHCDLNQLMVRNPGSTYLFTVEGDSMNLAGIADGDQLVVDRKLEARDGDIVVAIILGEGHTLKRLRTRGPRPRLVPESSNPLHKLRELREHDEWLIWGVVTGALKRFR